MELVDLTISQIHQGLKKKEFSAVEVCLAYLNRIKKKDKKIFAFLTVSEELALSQAKRVDELIFKNKKISLLAGVPVAIKDNILVENLRCTAGSKILENYIAPYSATVIKKLEKQGAVILGKTNLDEFGMGSSTDGASAAVAAKESVYALGSDTFWGVVGLKPTYGVVSRYGLIAPASSLDQIGPMTRTVEDCQIVFEAIKGKDERDSTSVNSKFQITNSKQIQNSKFKIRNLKIGVPKEYFVRGIDPGVEKVIKKAIKKYEDMGAKIEEISLPHTEYALPCYYIIASAEASANLARYDGIRFGFSKANSEIKNQKSKIKDLLDIYLSSRGEGFGEEVRRRIMLGTYALSAGYYGAYYLRAQKVRTLIKQDFNKAFEKVEAILTPCLADIHTVPVNLAGLPALCLPVGKIGNLPVGLQIIGKPFEETQIFEIGKAYDRHRYNNK